MKNFLIKHKQLLIDIAVLISVFFFVTLAYFIFKPLYFKSQTGLGTSDGSPARLFTFLQFTIVIVIGVVLKIRGKLTFHILIFLIFLIGVILQLNYMLMTPYNYRQHDVLSHNNCGHEGYAWTIYTTGKLPTQLDSQGHLEYQFYHPPLNALTQAMFMRISKIFMQGYNFIVSKQYYDVNDMNTMFQTSEILATFYMNIAIYFGIKTVYRLKIENKFKLMGVVFIALFPALILLAGQENNDPLCIMNCFIVIYYTLRWWEDRSYFSAAMIGLFTGLAMFAKLSGALIIVPAIVLFAIVLVQSIIGKDYKLMRNLLIQGAIIGAISLPLGLWFHIYAKIRFNQPFGFVFSNLTDKLYKGDISVIKRFFNIFDFEDLFVPLYGNTFENYNLPNFMIKSAIFGEYSFLGGDAIGYIALFSHYLFTYSSLALIVIYFIFSKKEQLGEKILGLTIIVTQLIAQLYFNIKMPYGCTMDFRYIVPIILGFMILDVLAFDKFFKQNDWKKYYSIGVVIVGSIFIASSSLFYLFAY